METKLTFRYDRTADILYIPSLLTKKRSTFQPLTFNAITGSAAAKKRG